MMMEKELLSANYLINDGIKVKYEDFVDADDVVVEDSGGGLFPTDYADDGRTEMDPKVDDDNEDNGRLLKECLSFNKRLVVKLTRLPESDGREKIKMVKMTNQVDPEKGHQYKRSRVKHQNQKLPNVRGKTTKSNNVVDVDQLIKDCQDKRLVILLERIPIIGKTRHQQVQNNGVKVKRLKLANNEDKYHLKSTLQAKVDNAKVEDKIICVFCQKEFKDYSSRRTHYENHHKSTWTCKFPNCTETFTSDSKNLYVFHKLTHEIENFKYFWDKKMCPICKEHYEQRKLKEFRKHIISHQNQILVPSTSTSKSSKKSQIKEQSICTTCDKSFSSKYTLDRHIKLVHIKRPGEKCEICTVCGDKFLSSESLQDHQRDFHQIFECSHDNCNLTFDGKRKFDDHLILEHEKENTTTIATSSSKKSQIKGPFICKTCGKSFTRMYNLKTHKKIVHNTTTPGFRCKDCYRVLKKESTLQDHKEKFHQIFECHHDNCNLTFEGKTKFDDHLIKEHEKDTTTTAATSSSKKSQIKEQFICDTCGKSFKRKYSLNKHTKLVHSTTRSGFKCEECDKILKKESTLQDHKEKFHQIFECYHDNCNLIFEGKTKFDDHLIKEHEIDTTATTTTTNMKSKERPILTCDLCDKYKTLKKDDLRRHKSDVHSTSNPVKCTMCNNVFKNERRLKAHVSKYHQPLKCTVGDCTRTFKKQSTLDGHVRKHNEKYMCEICSTLIPNFSSNIHSHMITVHRDYKCQMDNCKAELHTETQLLLHQKEVHDPEMKPEHLCPTCGFSYWTKNNLDRHRLEHKYGRGNYARSSWYKNKKPFVNRKCRFCEKEFTSRYNLVIHEKSHEKIQKEQKALEEYDGPKFPCSYCDKIYTKKKSLIYHTEMNHTKKLIFKCDFEGCDKIFKTNRSLKEHKDSKHLKIKINCKLCTNIFTNNGALASHLLKVHKKERDYPFECNVAGCGEKFYRDKYLQDHIDQVHKNC